MILILDSVRLYLRGGIRAVKTECQISIKSRIEMLYSLFKPGPSSPSERENASDGWTLCCDEESVTAKMNNYVVICMLTVTWI